MPALSFKGSLTTGHQFYPPTTVMDGSPDTFVGNKPASRVGDSIAVHCDVVDEDHPCHNGKIVSGSSKVFINNKQAGRIGDPTSCGDRVASGFPTCQVG